ncbi:MAG TPA: aminodeoxychorismate synthase component I [Nocardioides sp.]|jgi:aminodeoxychorismate synthase component I|nr:aminodeoxychorismate synthase component I [Nocardioides sp.]
MAEGPSTLREVAARHPRCFWLDGVHERGWPGLGPVVGWLADDDVSLSYDATTGGVARHRGRNTEVVGEDMFTVLEDEVASGPADAVWVGWFGYAARPGLPARTGAGLPDAVWLRADPRRLVAVDSGPSGPEAGVGGVRPGVVGDTGALTDETAYATAFAAVQEHLRAGDSYEVNLTYRVRADADTDPVTAYLSMRDRSPAPYAGFVQHDVPGARGWLLSASPERFASVDAGRRIEARPIKGTLPRGATPEADRVLAARLAAEPRFRAENLMIVDLMRNDLSRVCDPGTVEVPSLMAVESYAQVHQLVSTVTGRLRAEVGTVAALRSVFPPGSMTGAPKLRTMEIIEDVEGSPRGVYSGAFGWLRPDGRADLAVVIRSLTTAGDGHWTLGTGGGITVRSGVDEELAESYDKARALLAALRSR